MRLFVRLCVLLLVLALATPFFLRGPDGAPLATIQDVRGWFAKSFARADTSLNRIGTRVARWAGDDTAGKTAVYRWRDIEGSWHYADVAPAGVEAELIYVDGTVNLYRASEADTDNGASTNRPSAAGATGSPRNLIDDAKAARRALEERPLPE